MQTLFGFSVLTSFKICISPCELEYLLQLNFLREVLAMPYIQHLVTYIE